jgi:Tfp pilus assembly protein PilP
MELTPRLLALAVALAFVFASPYVVGSQSQPAPAAQTGRTSAGQAPSPPTKVGAPAAPLPAGQVAPKTPAPAPAPAAAPAPAPAAAAPAPQQATPSPSGPQLEPQGFTYDPAGRRDPFVSLVRRGTNTQKPTLGGARGPGLAGLESGEINLKGTIATQGGFVAIVQGSDNKTYIVRAGDKLADGTIRTITQDGMVITQQVTDPLSLEKTREVRKVLRQTEEAK